MYITSCQAVRTAVDIMIVSNLYSTDWCKHLHRYACLAIFCWHGRYTKIHQFSATYIAMYQLVIKWKVVTQRTRQRCLGCQWHMFLPMKLATVALKRFKDSTLPLRCLVLCINNWSKRGGLFGYNYLGIVCGLDRIENDIVSWVFIIQNVSICLTLPHFILIIVIMCPLNSNSITESEVWIITRYPGIRSWSNGMHYISCYILLFDDLCMLLFY